MGCGGARRKRSQAPTTSRDWGALATIRRLLEVAVLDTLSLENSIARSRTIAYLAQVSVNLLDKGELESRLVALEDTLRRNA